MTISRVFLNGLMNYFLKLSHHVQTPYAYWVNNNSIRTEAELIKFPNRVEKI